MKNDGRFGLILRKFSAHSMIRAWIYFPLLLICGCSYLTGIPTTWPEYWPTLIKHQADRCPDVSGSYDNVGISVAPTIKDSLLRWFMKIPYPNNFSQADVIELALRNDETLHILVKGGDGQVIKETTLSRSVRDFTCDEDGLSPKSVSGFIGGDGAAGYQKHVISFTTAKGGILAGKVRNTSYGFAWMFPIMGTQTMWYRWDPAASIRKNEK